jgi:plastocyanin
MKNIRVSALILLGLVIITGLLTLTSCQGTQTTATSANGTSVSIAPGSEASVLIQNSTFVPGSIIVSVGTKVTWTNKDRMAVSVKSGIRGTSDAGKLFYAPNIETDASFSYTFTKAGTYPYFEDIHIFTGEVIVK